MGTRGDGYDNALMESLFATLECELLTQHRFRTHEEARTAIFEWLEVFYNRHRRHSALGYVAPAVYEQLVTTLTSGAA
jgi:transposase InsO family protein